MDNTESYTIIDGFFCSTKTSPKEIIEFVTEDYQYCKAQYGDKRIIIWPNGDTMLRIWSDKYFTIIINTFVFKSENNELKLFEGGLPLYGQFKSNLYIYTPGIEKVYVEFENYSDEYRKTLSLIGDNGDDDDEGCGVKLHSNNNSGDYQIIGKCDPGNTHNTITKLL